LVVTVIGGILPANLNASVEASEPHDFAVRLRAVRQRHIRVHRIPSRVSDDREPPLWWDETAQVMALIWGKREPKCFCKPDWTGQISLIRLNKSAFCENHPGAILLRPTL
jgi:hypothetical protein